MSPAGPDHPGDPGGPRDPLDEPGDVGGFRRGPDPDIARRVRELLAAARAAGEERTAMARVDDGEQLLDVSVAPGGRWRVRSSTVEWALTSEGLLSWHVTHMGAHERDLREPEGWIHPAVGLLRPDMLPVWGRLADRYRPVSLLEGTSGYAMVGLEPNSGDVVGGFAVEPGATMHLDTRRHLVTCLELPQRTWTLLDVE